MEIAFNFLYRRSGTMMHNSYHYSTIIQLLTEFKKCRKYDSLVEG
jgi:hypothetical protein